MPRARSDNGKSPEEDQFSLLWKQLGEKPDQNIRGMDFDAALLMQAILDVVDAGNTVVFRRGSGGESLGIAIWTRQKQNDPVWCSSDERVEAWAKGAIQVAKKLRGEE